MAQQFMPTSAAQAQRGQPKSTNVTWPGEIGRPGVPAVCRCSRFDTSGVFKHAKIRTESAIIFSPTATAPTWFAIWNRFCAEKLPLDAHPCKFFTVYLGWMKLKIATMNHSQAQISGQRLCHGNFR